MKRIMIITGATGGIGREFVRLLTEEIDEIWAIGRTESKLLSLQEIAGNKLIPLIADLSTEEGIAPLLYKLNKEKPKVAYLINCAGDGSFGPFDKNSVQAVQKMICLSCSAPAAICNCCLPYMSEGSHIINLCSQAAFQPNPYLTLYASQKAFLRSFTRALNVELKDRGIKAMAVCPGWVETDLLQFQINGKEVHFPGIVSAQKVVKQAIADAKKGKDMSVCTMYVKKMHFYSKILPQKFIMKQWMKMIAPYLDSTR